MSSSSIRLNSHNANKMYNKKSEVINNTLLVLLTLSANIHSISMLQSPYSKSQTGPHSSFSVPPPVTVITTLASINNQQERPSIDTDSRIPSANQINPILYYDSQNNDDHDHNKQQQQQMYDPSSIATTTATSTTTTTSSPQDYINNISTTPASLPSNKITSSSSPSASLLDQTLSTIARDLMSKFRSTDNNNANNAAGDLQDDELLTDESTETGEMSRDEGDKLNPTNGPSDNSKRASLSHTSNHNQNQNHIQNHDHNLRHHKATTGGINMHISNDNVESNNVNSNSNNNNNNNASIVGKSNYYIESQQQQANNKQYRQLDHNGSEIGYGRLSNPVNSPMSSTSSTPLDSSQSTPSSLLGSSISFPITMGTSVTSSTSPPPTSTLASIQHQNNNNLQYTQQQHQQQNGKQHQNLAQPSRPMSLAPYANDHYHRSESANKMPPLNLLGQTFDLPTATKSTNVNQQQQQRHNNNNNNNNNNDNNDNQDEQRSMLDSISQISATLTNEAANQHRLQSNNHRLNSQLAAKADGQSSVLRNDHQMQYSPIGNLQHNVTDSKVTNNVGSTSLSSSRHPQMDANLDGSINTIKSNGPTNDQQQSIRGVNDRYVSLSQQYADINELGDFITNNLSNGPHSVTYSGQNTNTNRTSNVSSMLSATNNKQSIDLNSSKGVIQHNQLYSNQHSLSSSMGSKMGSGGAGSQLGAPIKVTPSSVNTNTIPPSIMIVRDDNSDRIGPSDNGLTGMDQEDSRSQRRGIGSPSTIDSIVSDLGISSAGISDEFHNHNTILNPISTLDIPPPDHYAASLVNLTAPMIPPSSASEAMESTIQAENMYHLVSLGQSGNEAPPPPMPNLHHLHQQQQQHQTISTTTNDLSNATLNMYANSLPSQQQHLLSSSGGNGGNGGNGGSGGVGGSLISSTSNQKIVSPSGINATATLDENQRLRLYGSTSSLSGRRPAYLPPNVPQGNQASGFRSPLLMSSNSKNPNLQSGAATTSPVSGGIPLPPPTILPPPASLLAALSLSTLSPYLGSVTPGSMASIMASSPSSLSYQPDRYNSAFVLTQNQNISSTHLSSSGLNQTVTANPATGIANKPTPINPGDNVGPTAVALAQTGTNNNGGSFAGPSSAWSKRPFNITRVEHISAECSNDLIRTVIIFNGTFKGIIYSSGYVQDTNCLYVNGTGKTRYEFNIKLNQCGTLGRQEEHRPTAPGGARRRDQVMWNTLSIQYNSIIEQEWDEHFRVSCEYGSDFWKTISFNPFNVETNTGSPVVFTINPPQCQMEILRGHGMVGPRQEAVSGPVTVGDPLTLLIHMKSEKAGYDILVKNCVAHNGGHQKMQLIDQNGCVVNERFISPFRGSYNDNDLRHVTLYSYLKAFRFTGSPVLYLECEIHMCQSACPPQMCYWRRLSKRSTNDTIAGNDTNVEYSPHKDDRFMDDPTLMSDDDMNDDRESSQKKDGSRNRRNSRYLRQGDNKSTFKLATSTALPSNGGYGATNDSPAISDKVSLFQALEVRQEKDPGDINIPNYNQQKQKRSESDDVDSLVDPSVVCYRHGEVVAFMITIVALLVVAIGITVGCCWRASNLKHYYNKKISGYDASANKKRPFAFMSPLDYLFPSSSDSQASTLFNNQYNHHIAPMSPAPASPSASSYCESISSIVNNFSSTHHQAQMAQTHPRLTNSKNHCQVNAKPWSMINYDNRGQQQQQQQQQTHPAQQRNHQQFIQCHQNSPSSDRTAMINSFPSSGNLLLPVQSERQHINQHMKADRFRSNINM